MTDKIGESKHISLTIGNVHLPSGTYHVPESYLLHIDASHNNIKIVGQSPVGVFYGIQTLISIYDELTGRLPAVRVTDAPRFEYRGLMMDLSRNFHSNKTEIKRVLEAMASYKMNRLHLHLGDDEGWRLEIPGLPELTEVNSCVFYLITSRNLFFTREWIHHLELTITTVPLFIED